MQHLGRVCRQLRSSSVSGRRVAQQRILNYTDRPPPPPPGYKWQTFAGVAAISAVCSAMIYNFYGHTLIPKKNNYNNNALHISNNFQELQDFKLRDRFNFINKVVEKCAPSVVYVEIRDTRKIDKETDSQLIVSNGSGFIVSDDGWILTNAHVVINKPSAVVQVKMQDGKTYTATVENADMNIDLALIKINPEGKLPALPLAKSGDVSVGEWVVALGSPLSLSHSATAGVVSCVNRNANELGLRNYQMRYIQTDAPITFGNSGGPLVNLDGEVIGINNLRITAGISFAIPVEFVSKFLDRIHYINENKVLPVHTVNNLGITTITMNHEIVDDVATKFQLLSGDIKQGVLIWKVMRSSQGEKIGFLVGDVVTHVNDEQVNSTVDLYDKLLPGKKNVLKVLRNGKTITLAVDS